MDECNTLASSSKLSQRESQITVIFLSTESETSETSYICREYFIDPIEGGSYIAYFN